MQLILDSDDIDIKRNMSTIEQESLNEKFLTNKIIEHLTDDICSGNKENIQKQDNVIPNLGEKDTDKETVSDEVILENNRENIKDNKPGDNTKDDKSDTENVENEKEIVNESNGFDTDLEAACDDPIILNLIEKESLAGENEVSLNDEQNRDKIKEFNQENETNVAILDNNTNLDGLENVKKLDITKLELDTNKNNKIEVETLNAETEKDVNKDLDQNAVPKLELNKINSETDLSESEPIINDNENVKRIAIEIDYENENTKDKNNHLTSNIEHKIDETKINSLQKDTSNEILEIEDEKEKKNKENNLSVQELVEKMEDLKEATQVIIEPKSPEKDVPIEIASQERKTSRRFCKLSNNLDIFSDDDEDLPETPKDDIPPSTEKKCISIDDDDDIMLIDEDSNTKDGKNIEDTITDSDCNQTVPEIKATNEDIATESTPIAKVDEAVPHKTDTPDVREQIQATAEVPNTETNEKVQDKVEEKGKTKKPLLPKNFMKSCKKNLADMTRDDLEEFCILKIVESIVDRSNLGEIKAQLKNLTQTMEECKKKCLMLSKQNKDLQVVLKSVQEEQKSGSDVHNIAPLKITRSVGMQIVMMVEKNNGRKKSINGLGSSTPITNNENKPVKVQTISNNKVQKDKNPNNQQIPVPRLVPAATAAKTNQMPAINNSAKQTNTTILPNGVRNPQPMNKVPEKRGRSQSVTVDLTDDEPPAKISGPRGTLNPAVRVTGATQSIIAAQRYGPNINSPRKVYIPISGPQAQNVRPGQTIMLKTVTGITPRQRFPTPQIAKVPQAGNQMRLGRIQPNRHPAPLPEAAKQYQPPNWKTLPPPPDLKLSKVENGIVISWKIDGYQEDNHEEIASYQLYAYQETQSPPSSTLWKKIGDVKALPLPMACTLTQFMAGYKYYFAVRAVDVRSRIGPFSLPGSILLLNKI